MINSTGPIGNQQPTSLWSLIKRYRVTVTYPVVVSTLIYLDWARTQRYKASKAAAAASQQGQEVTIGSGSKK